MSLPFTGNAAVWGALRQMAASGRMPQTLLFSGPEGVGKATLARRLGALLLSGEEQIERDDLSRDENLAVIAEREKWPSEKRSEDPLFFSSHPDFVTFPPEGPLRQLSIQQMRLLRTRAQLRPLKGNWRVFLIDHIDRASQQAADSLLKTLEEPPSHLILALTAENAYDLPPTIRSRSILFQLTPVAEDEMRAFARARGLSDVERRLALAGGCPGLAATINLAEHEKRRALMLAMLEAAGGVRAFSAWAKQSESFLQSKSEKLDAYIKPLYSLLSDLTTLHGGGRDIRNADLAAPLAALAGRVSFAWLREAVAQADELTGLQRRNVQKGLTVDSFVATLRSA